MNSLTTRSLKSLSLVLVITVLLGLGDAFASSNPIPGVGIVVKRNPGSSTARTKTDKEGNFKFDKLEPGTYTLEVQADDLTKSLAKLESQPPARAGHAMASTSSSTGKRASTEASGSEEASAPLTAEISLSLDVQAAASGATTTIRQFTWTQVSGPVTFTVGEDGVLEGQLRAGISTSRSNLRTK